MDNKSMTRDLNAVVHVVFISEIKALSNGYKTSPLE